MLDISIISIMILDITIYREILIDITTQRYRNDRLKETLCTFTSCGNCLEGKFNKKVWV